MATELEELRNNKETSNTTLRDCLKSATVKKETYISSIQNVHGNHPHQKIIPDVLGALFNTTFMRTASTEKAANGFRNTRVCPLNPDVFTEEDILAVDA
jgi:hypothetical protein